MEQRQRKEREDETFAEAAARLLQEMDARIAKRRAGQTPAGIQNGPACPSQGARTEGEQPGRIGAQPSVLSVGGEEDASGLELNGSRVSFRGNRDCNGEWLQNRSRGVDRLPAVGADAGDRSRNAPYGDG